MLSPLAAALLAAAVAAEPAPLNPDASFAFSNRRFHNEPVVLWPGFLSGLRGFEHFYEPIGNPIYFESPFNTSMIRLLYLHHTFADNSRLQGGHLNVYAVQARLALTERLAFIATKDGYSDLNASALPNDEGWNDIAVGAKYTFFADHDLDLLLAAGLRWQWGNGDAKVLQGGCQELSPFFSFAKGFDRLHLVGCISDRIPLDSDKGNNILQWDLHLDLDIAPESLPGLAPLIEIHGLHYLDNGTRTPLKVGGADYTNLGSTDVSGSTLLWMGLGARWKLSPNFSLGAAYEFALTNRNADIFSTRATVDFIINW